MRAGRGLSYFVSFALSSSGCIICTATENSESSSDITSNFSLSLDDINRELEQGDDIESDLKSDLQKYANDIKSSMAQIMAESNKGKDVDQKRIDQLTKEYEEARKKAQKIIETIRKRRAERSLATEFSHPQDKPDIENVISGTNCPVNKKKRKIADAKEEHEDLQER
jgi:uncharacterized phage infection (PIP) family protein YhgE